MSDGYKRKHESGFEKRKKKEQKDEALKKIKGALNKFINTNCNKDMSVTSLASSITTHLSVPEIIPTDTGHPEQSEIGLGDINEQICHGSVGRAMLPMQQSDDSTRPSRPKPLGTVTVEELEDVKINNNNKFKSSDPAQ